MSTSYDIILVGGGLANGLLADRLVRLRPELRLLLVEQGQQLGGNHTWSFHDTDLTRGQWVWLEPYVVHRWIRQEVRFNGYTRVLNTGYATVTSDRFHEVLSERLGERLRTHVDVVQMTPTSVRLADQSTLTAACVIDGRGPQASAALALGFQKFIGREVETAEPHGRRWPIIMDATVDQRDGYRFVYTLPLDERRLLIEDTYYSDGAALDLARLSGRIDAYAAEQGWSITRDLRVEHGVLPIVLAGDMQRFWQDDGVPRLGLRAALFHPTTGYSLPDAVRAAEMISALPDLSAASVRHAVERFSVDTWEARAFYRLLNRMLFLAAADEERASIMERFYTLPEPLIRRFYEGQLSLADKARIVTGRPPIAISRALPCLSTAPAWRFSARNGGQP